MATNEDMIGRLKSCEMSGFVSQECQQMLNEANLTSIKSKYNECQDHPCISVNHTPLSSYKAVQVPIMRTALGETYMQTPTIFSQDRSRQSTPIITGNVIAYDPEFSELFGEDLSIKNIFKVLAEGAAISEVAGNLLIGGLFGMQAVSSGEAWRKGEFDLIRQFPDEAIGYAEVYIPRGVASRPLSMSSARSETSGQQQAGRSPRSPAPQNSNDGWLARARKAVKDFVGSSANERPQTANTRTRPGLQPANIGDIGSELCGFAPGNAEIGHMIVETSDPSSQPRQTKVSEEPPSPPFRGVKF